MPGCANPVCTNDLPQGATARRRYCSNACRQAGARARKRPRLADADTRRLDATVRDLAGQLASAARSVAEEPADAPNRAVALTGLPAQVHQVMRAAVAFERASGTTWEEIGRRLELHPDTARRRYEPRTEGERWSAMQERWSPSMRARRLRQAVDLVLRGWYLEERFPDTTACGRIVFNDHPGSGSRANFLALLYDTVLAEHPELAPQHDRVADAVADVDLAAIDALYAPLDRAVRHFLSQTPPALWQDQLRAHIDVLDQDSGPHWQRKRALASSYRRATGRGWPYHGACQTLDAILTQTFGGHAPGALVRLRTETTAYVLDAQWRGPDGAPDSYTVLPTGPGAEHKVRADQILGPASPEDGQ